MEAFEILIVGAGQAGLAAGFHLRQRGVSFTLIEGRGRIGDSWRERYDSLVLFSSRAYSALPGLALTGDPSGYPGKNEIADYLEHYARMMRLPVIMNARLTSLEQRDHTFVAAIENGQRIRATSVIIATGPFQKPLVPAFARDLNPAVAQLTGATYRRPEQLPAGRVLVVGDGATGRQVSRELTATHEVWLATGKFRLVVPQRFLGRDIIACFETTGALRADKESWHGRFVQLFDPIPGWSLRLPALRRAGVRVVRRAVQAEDRAVEFADGSAATFDAVIWAIGYHDDSSWLQIPEAVDQRGNYIQNRGVSPVPGLFHIGREWQNNRASALLTGVGNDAVAIANQSLEFVQSHRPQPNEQPAEPFP